ncbi:MAG: hypothetical protein IJ688_01415 [Treponema sp.]|nr:hypothetical protein [Treponema sp.]
MKKRHLFWIIPTAIISLILILLITYVSIQVNYPDGYKPTFYKSKNKPNLTQKEMQEDLDYLKYYLKNAYIGYAQLLEEGFDIDAIIKEVEEKTWEQKDSTNHVSSNELNGQLKKALTPEFKIIDKHFSIGGWGPKDDYKLFWSDIYLTKNESAGKTEYRILKYQPEAEENESDESEAKSASKKKKRKNKSKKEAEEAPKEIIKGALYTGPENNLYEWFDGEQKIYRYGIYTKQQIQKAIISVNNENISIPVKSEQAIPTAALWQGMKESPDTLYLSFADFVFYSQDNSGKKQFKTLCQNAREKAKDKKNIIIDLRSNGGGEASRACYLLSNLLYYNQDAYENLYRFLTYKVENKSIRLMSPPIAKNYIKFLLEEKKAERAQKKLLKKIEDPEKFEFDEIYKETYISFEKQTKEYCLKELIKPERLEIPCDYVEYDSSMEKPESDFSGNIYILTNHHSASCSEYTIAYTKLIADGNQKIHFYQIGENTNGAVSYYNPMVYNLPNSGLQLYFPSAYTPPFEDPAFKGEGCGWHPDYWTTNRNLLNTLIQLTGDQELKETLAGLDKRML